MPVHASFVGRWWTYLVVHHENDRCSGVHWRYTAITIAISGAAQVLQSPAFQMRNKDDDCILDRAPYTYTVVRSQYRSLPRCSHHGHGINGPCTNDGNNYWQYGKTIDQTLRLPLAPSRTDGSLSKPTSEVCRGVRDLERSVLPAVLCACNLTVRLHPSPSSAYVTAIASPYETRAPSFAPLEPWTSKAPWSLPIPSTRHPLVQYTSQAKSRTALW
jgi:hypothetical protein